LFLPSELHAQSITTHATQFLVPYEVLPSSCLISSAPICPDVSSVTASLLYDCMKLEQEDVRRQESRDTVRWTIENMKMF